MTDFHPILAAAEEGDPKAAEQLLPLVYDELRKLAAQRIANEKPGLTLEATSLVHEAYLRLVGNDQPWHGRAHFFAAAAEAMRRILIERSRSKHRLRREGSRNRVPLDNVTLEQAVSEDEILAVHEALDILANKTPEAVDVVKLRYFVGMTLQEIAEALGMSLRSVNRHWAYAKAWLFQHLQRDSEE